MKEKYKLINDNKILFEFRCRDIKKIETVIPRVLGRNNRKQYISEILKTHNFKEYEKCKFCNCEYYRIPFYEINVVEDSVIIKNVKLSKYQESQDKVFYGKELLKCGRKECIGTNLNKNSIEYVSKIFNLTEKEACKHIHKRNSSPFYVENHESVEEYKKFQRVFKDGCSEEEKARMIKLQNYKKSLEYYVDIYGIDEGIQKYKSINSKKAITLENMIRLYGEDGMNKYNNWLDKVLISEQNMIKKYGEEEGKIRWNKYLSSKNTKSRGKISYTKTGKILRSSYEQKFYDVLLKHGFTDDDIDVEKNYPNSQMRCDFYIKKYDLYIEIAGMMGDKSYSEKMEYKQIQFGSLIVSNKMNYEEIILKIKRGDYGTEN